MAGQVVFAHRKIAEQFLPPENPITWPYTKLQEFIYNWGAQLLSKDDGEMGVWKNQWFLYLYSRKSHRPYGVGNLEHVERMVALLDSC